MTLRVTEVHEASALLLLVENALEHLVGASGLLLGQQVREARLAELLARSAEQRFHARVRVEHRALGACDDENAVRGGVDDRRETPLRVLQLPVAGLHEAMQRAVATLHVVEDPADERASGRSA